MYEYLCANCGKRFELIQKFVDAPLTVHEECGGGPVERLISAPALQFKGTGWYVTDYAKGNGSGSNTGSESKGKSEGSGEGSKSDSKSEGSKSESGKSEGSKAESAKSESSKSDSSGSGKPSSTPSPASSQK